MTDQPTPTKASREKLRRLCVEHKAGHLVGRMQDAAEQVLVALPALLDALDAAEERLHSAIQFIREEGIRFNAEEGEEGCWDEYSGAPCACRFDDEGGLTLECLMHKRLRDKLDAAEARLAELTDLPYREQRKGGRR